MGMEGPVAKWYASLTAKSMDEFKALARRIAETLPKGSHVLEVAPGPGYFAIEMAKLGYRVSAIDISRTFVEIAQRNASLAGVKVKFRQGDAAHMPFDSGQFDYVLCRAAFKNFTDPVGAIEEMYRVLAPGGRAEIIDLRRDASNESIRRAVDEMHVGALNAAITKLTFRFMLLKRAYTKREIEQFVAATAFGQAEITENLLGFDVTMRKQVDLLAPNAP